MITTTPAARYATPEKLAILGHIRAGRTDAAWLDVVQRATGFRVTDERLSIGQAEKVIALANCGLL